MRIISLLPSATEVVAALGGMEHLVGVTHACDHPPAVATRPRVTTTAIDALATPGTVDAQVREIARLGAPLYALLEERIRDLQPDLILTQALCDVCAVMEDDVRALAARLLPAPRVITLSASTLDGVLEDMRIVGAALGRPAAADDLVSDTRARLQSVHETLKAARAPRPRVAVIEWSDPPYAAGHWVPDMVRRAGGVDVLAAPGAHSVAVSSAAVRAADPEVVLIAPCGYDLARAVAEGNALLARDEWAWARTRRVVALDANAFVSRPGPRLADGVEIFARIFNPALFPAVEPAAARALTRVAHAT